MGGGQALNVGLSLEGFVIWGSLSDLKLPGDGAWWWVVVVV